MPPLRMLCLTAVAAVLALLAPVATAQSCGYGYFVKMTNYTLPRQLPPGNYVKRSAVTENWSPIRITVFTEDLDDPKKYCTAAGELRPDFLGRMVRCKQEDVLTGAKRNTLLNTIIPMAVKMHADRLLVQPVGTIVVPSLNGRDGCENFAVPESHHTDGVSNTDYVMYVSAAPTPPPSIAWATACFGTEEGIPVIGVANFSPASISKSEFAVRTLAHEFLHALGFNSATFHERNMLKGTRLRGLNISVVNSARVMQAVDSQYNCSTTEGMELEHWDSSEVANEHWSYRNAPDELMSGYTGSARYTALTIAAMEDTGFYRGNYDKAEYMKWGSGAGCWFLLMKCVMFGHFVSPDVFCDSTYDGIYCSPSRQDLGSCIIKKYKNTFPEPYRYFLDAHLGGLFEYADYCPILRGTEGSSGFVDTNCITGDRTYMPLSSKTSESSRCLDFDTSVTVGGVPQYGTCVNIYCLTDTYSIQVKGANRWVDCPAGGTVDVSAVSPSVFTKGTRLTCAPFEEVCPIVFNSGVLDRYADGVAVPPHSGLFVAALVAVLLVAAVG